MSGGKGKSHGGKAGPKGAADGSRQQVSHSAKAGLQVRNFLCLRMVVCWVFGRMDGFARNGKTSDQIEQIIRDASVLDAFEILLVAVLCKFWEG